MGELVIQRHDFEEAKKKIKEFSEQTTTDLDLNRVNDKKDFGEWLGDFFLGGGIGLNHKVTGEELNELTVHIQKHLHSINNTQIKLIKEFGQVYNALDILDEKYLQVIWISIKATEKTSERIESTQGQIKRIVEDQKRTLEVLKKFKQKLDTYAHLDDIDNIWSNCQKWHKENETLSGVIKEISDESQTNAKSIETINDNQKSANEQLASLVETVNRQIAQMETIVALTNSILKKQIPEIQKKYEETNIHMTELNETFNAALVEMEDKNEITVQELTQKIKVTYWLVGGLIGAAVMELLFILIKVM